MSCLMRAAEDLPMNASLAGFSSKLQSHWADTPIATTMEPFCCYCVTHAKLCKGCVTTHSITAHCTGHRLQCVCASLSKVAYRWNVEPPPSIGLATGKHLNLHACRNWQAMHVLCCVSKLCTLPESPHRMLHRSEAASCQFLMPLSKRPAWAVALDLAEPA